MERSEQKEPKGVEFEGWNDVYSLNNRILIAWDQAQTEINKYELYSSKGNKTYGVITKNAINRLLLIVRQSLQKEMTQDQWDLFIYKITNTNIDLVIDAYYTMDKYLYDKNITKFDKNKKYDRGIAEEANKARGL